MGFHRFGLGVIAATVFAAQAEPAQERAQLHAQIERIKAEQAAEERACKQRFAVTSCVDEARQRGREAIAPLRARQLEIDDTERSARAASRREVVDAKRAEAAQRASAPALRTAAPRASQPASASAPGPAASARPPRAPVAAARHQAAASEAAQRAQATVERQDRIREDAERIRARQAEREKKKRPAAPLPVPDAASLPRR